MMWTTETSHRGELVTDGRQRATRTVATLLALCAIAGLIRGLHAQEQPAIWAQPQQPFRIFGNIYYVGTRGISAILITSPTGAVLIDGAVPDAAANIARNITTVGTRLDDVKLIVNSHVHIDHAGGIAELQRLTGARVAALPWSAEVLRKGRKDPRDPQFDIPMPPADAVASVDEIRDGQTLSVGSVTITAHKTAGHTPGGTTWTWRSCENERCADVVYADSISAVSADGFHFTSSRTYPQAVGDFTNSFRFLRTVSCDVLLTPHPEASDLWERIARRDAGDQNALVDRTQCRRYADRGEAQFRKRLNTERR